ncbi:tRNA(Ser) (uridine(44)-2'-O)-methyltransferase [Malassezia vespertilionis]|uniref:tRNA (uracil-O(2)-)-methyltransferase n=1 Tax=Malassezia vespertilionis TaxID=2020962 RepID=A0A2N1JB66_9BASI|nr:tRNA(Ser) (uridine(44)-2'-O)-methyltransferase [Malassezia vespertilionis]PKI83752.1 Trm44p [Malassezia vespertilionis]WFD07332.1 tRNA(Ser) (uridine(44)-2'-O)-methyltransferase [Malassezia vespertilionis]
MAKDLFRPCFVAQDAQAYGRHGLLDEVPWIPIVTAPAPYSKDDWLAAMLAWIQHAERNSSSIRRCELWGEQKSDGALMYRCIRRLLPRRTHIDSGMLQECAIYTENDDATVVYTTLRNSAQETEAPDGEMLHRARTQQDYPQDASQVPYYHPAVRALAFHYRAAQCCVQIDMIPFPGTGNIAQDARLGRTALSLLRLMHQHSYGHATSYVKRVEHDILVPRDAYQDLYLALRTRYAGELIRTWAEVTDPKKHVFEDIGIATWLILLWRSMFSQGAAPGGFVDVGCGNGLLVHILTLEGYRGYGFDARARRSWAQYREHGADLQTCMLDAAEIVSREASPFPRGAFLIGNHADELTPWLPLLATSTQACAGYINIPCCAWTLDGTRFVPTQYTLDRKKVAEWVTGAHLGGQDPVMPPAPHTAISEDANVLLQHTLWFFERMVAAPEQAVSKHFAYYAYIATLHLRAGWVLETEALRIPSTKNWTLVARRKIGTDAASTARLDVHYSALVQEARAVQTRIPAPSHE